MTSSLRLRSKRVRLKHDIVDVVRCTVSLTKSGQTHKGLCPFHKEETPSFHVHRCKGFFFCFGCGSGGDVIKFVERTRGLSFEQALEALEEAPAN